MTCEKYEKTVMNNLVARTSEFPRGKVRKALLDMHDVSSAKLLNYLMQEN